MIFLFRNFLNPKCYILNSSQKGLIALPSVLIISMMILIAGLGLATVGYFEVEMSGNTLDSAKALNNAEAGAEDAIARVVKNTKCNEGESPDCTSYSLTMPKGTASITVSGVGTKTIVSEGVVGNFRRRVQVVLSVDSNDEVTQTSWTEITN